MLKNTFLFIGAFISTALTAQIVISSTDMPTAGDSIIISNSTSAGSSGLLLTGANLTWDYSSLTPSSQQYEKFDSPNTFTSPFNYLFTPNNTSFGKDNYAFTTIPLPGASITAAYDFFSESPSQLKQVGSGYSINAIPVPFLYSLQDIVYNFPMNFLNEDSCDYKFGLPIPTIGFYGEKGHRVNIVDGWGAITTPFGTFQTLRVKSTIASIDTIYYNSLNYGTNITRPLKYEFKWLATGMKVPVLEIDANVVAGNMAVTNVRYIDSTRTGVPQVGITENTINNLKFSAYPNPCIDRIVFQYSLTKTDKVKISITDVIGKIAAEIIDETQISGTYKRSINIGDIKLSPGIYFLNLQTNNFKETRKIVVAN